MKKNTKKNLALRSDTIRVIDGKYLAEAVGGSDGDLVGLSKTCPTTDPPK